MNLNKTIDHTLLKADATNKQIKILCKEAIEFDFASVCVNPIRVRESAELLKDSNVKVCTVIGFPLGATPTMVKIFEAEQALKDGAEELDMVINIGKIKDKDWDFVKTDIKALADLAHANNAILKVIFETCLLTDDEKKQSCKICVVAGADFVKTSTGFSTAGATIEDVKLMSQTVGDSCEVKASGGVRNQEQALNMIDAGATRLGTSSGIAIIQGKEGGRDY